MGVVGVVRGSAGNEARISTLLGFPELRKPHPVSKAQLLVGDPTSFLVHMEAGSNSGLDLRLQRQRLPGLFIFFFFLDFSSLSVLTDQRADKSPC